MITIFKQRFSKKHQLHISTLSTASNSIYYFGYGANLDPDFFKKRVPSFDQIGPASLEGYEFLFNTPCEYKSKGYGGIQKCSDSIVHGYLYSISKPVLNLLDSLEWVDFNFYSREQLQVTCNGQNFQAQVYVPVHPRNDLLAPQGYKNLIIAGAEKLNLPADYVDHLKKLPAKSNFELDNSFNLSNPGQPRLLPARFYYYHDLLREKLCELI